jgi:hypothetical protein
MTPDDLSVHLSARYSADKKLKPIGLRAKDAIDRGLAACLEHVWLCHLKIHLNEMGPVSAFEWDIDCHMDCPR